MTILVKFTYMEQKSKLGC